MDMTHCDVIEHRVVLLDSVMDNVMLLDMIIIIILTPAWQNTDLGQFVKNLNIAKIALITEGVIARRWVKKSA